MEQPSDVDLAARIDRLERIVVAVLAVVALVPLLVGWVLPWFDEERDDVTTRARLVTYGFQALNPPEGYSTDGSTALLGAGFLFLDVLTVAAVIVLLAVAQRSWRARRIGGWIVGLLLVCLAVVLLLTAVASGKEGPHLYVSAPLVWGSGVLLTTIVYFAPGLRALWLRDVAA